MPKAKFFAPQALFLALPRCSRRQNHALLALKITWGRETEAPHKLRTGDTSSDLPRSGRSKILIGILLQGLLLGRPFIVTLSRSGVEPSRGLWWGVTPEHIPEVWYRRNGGKSPNQNVRAPQRARGNVRAHRQNRPPCDPRASPDHPTWWMPPPGTHYGQGGDKSAHFGR